MLLGRRGRVLPSGGGGSSSLKLYTPIAMMPPAFHPASRLSPAGVAMPFDGPLYIHPQQLTIYPLYPVAPGPGRNCPSGGLPVTVRPYPSPAGPTTNPPSSWCPPTSDGPLPATDPHLRVRRGAERLRDPRLRGRLLPAPHRRLLLAPGQGAPPPSCSLWSPARLYLWAGTPGPRSDLLWGVPPGHSAKVLAKTPWRPRHQKA